MIYTISISLQFDIKDDKSFFSGRKKPVLVILIKNQRASIAPSQKWVTSQKNTTHMTISLFQSLPGGKARQ